MGEVVTTTTHEALHEILRSAEVALAVGDVPLARAELDRFDREVADAELDRNAIAAASWPLRIAVERSAGGAEEVLAQGSRLVRQARRQGWDQPLAELLVVMGKAALDLSDFSRASVWFEEAVSVADRVARPSLLASALLGDAVAWELQGENGRFRQQAERALEPAEQGDDLVVRAEVLTAIGRALLKSGEPAGSEKLVEAGELLAEAGAHVALIRNLLDRLVVPMSAGDLPAAEALLLRAEGLLGLVHDQQVHGRVAMDRGEWLRLSGQTVEAVAAYERALTLVQDDNPVARVARLNLALARVASNQHDEVRLALPHLLEITRNHALFQGMVHLIALAVGPKKRADEDAFWLEHGTPARLPLRGAGSDPDIQNLAHLASKRMLIRADPVQAGRAAMVMGIGAAPDTEGLLALRHAHGVMPIGPFLAMQRIGVGGMGEVWLGRHADTDQPAAIKVVNPEMSKNELALRSFENELRAVAGLSHPNIVRLLDHGRAGSAAEWTSQGRIAANSPYLALEFVRGGTLSSWMGKLSWSAARLVLTDLLRALGHAHARRVLHLDLKPDNVLLNVPGDPKGGVRLTDFGLALLREQSRQGMAGTTSFMAPEQFTGKGLGTHTDLYALGCLAWGMLTNRPPYENADVEALAKMHARAPLPAFQPLVEVPSGLLGWLERLLAKSPAKRFQRAWDALQALAVIDPEVDASLPEVVDLDTAAGISLIRERRPPLVGRELEREQLWDTLLTCAKRRRPMAVELHGPLGVGRTALMHWLGERAHERGVAEVIYQPVDQGLSAWLGGRASVSAGSLAVRLQQRLKELRSGRVLVFVTRAADPELADVLDILLREGEGPFLFLVRSPPGQLRQNRAIQRLALRPLRRDHMEQVLGSLVPLAPELQGPLVTWCEGNPGLGLAKLRELAANGELRPSTDGWASPHVREFWVPARLRNQIGPFLRGLADTAEYWEALQTAAALGSIVQGSLWTELCGDIGPLAARLEEAQVLEARGGTYRWIDTTSRHFVLQDRATRLAHARIAEHLAERGAPPAVVGRQLVAAHLFARAHRPLLDGVSAALQGGDKLVAQQLYREWSGVIDRLAVPANDPRRLAGRRLESRLQDAAGDPPVG